MLSCAHSSHIYISQLRVESPLRNADCSTASASSNETVPNAPKPRTEVEAIQHIKEVESWSGNSCSLVRSMVTHVGELHFHCILV